MLPVGEQDTAPREAVCERTSSYTFYGGIWDLLNKDVTMSMFCIPTVSDCAFRLRLDGHAFGLVRASCD